MRRYAIPFTLILLLLPPLAARQDETDEFINAQLREQNIPGLAPGSNYQYSNVGYFIASIPNRAGTN